MNVMRWIFRLALLLAASSAWAWPWTTPAECVRDYETLAQGKRSLMVIRLACDQKYKPSQTEAEAYEASCFLDRAHEPKSEIAFMVVWKRCRDEALTRYPPEPNPFDQFDEPAARFARLSGSNPFNDLIPTTAAADFFELHPDWATDQRMQLLRGRMDHIQATSGGYVYQQAELMRTAYDQLVREGY